MAHHPTSQPEKPHEFSLRHSHNQQRQWMRCDGNENDRPSNWNVKMKICNKFHILFSSHPPHDTSALATRDELNLKSLKRENFPARYANKATERSRSVNFPSAKLPKMRCAAIEVGKNRFRAPPRALKWICQEEGGRGKRKFITSRVRRVATVVECREKIGSTLYSLRRRRWRSHLIINQFQQFSHNSSLSLLTRESSQHSREGNIFGRCCFEKEKKSFISKDSRRMLSCLD